MQLRVQLLDAPASFSLTNANVIISPLHRVSIRSRSKVLFTAECTNYNSNGLANAESMQRVVSNVKDSLSMTLQPTWTIAPIEYTAARTTACIWQAMCGNGFSDWYAADFTASGRDKIRGPERSGRTHVLRRGYWGDHATFAMATRQGTYLAAGALL